MRRDREAIEVFMQIQMMIWAVWELEKVSFELRLCGPRGGTKRGKRNRQDP